jgi:hypothetical protein
MHQVVIQVEIGDHRSYFLNPSGRNLNPGLLQMTNDISSF